MRHWKLIIASLAAVGATVGGAAAAEGRGDQGGAESGNLLQPHDNRLNGCNRTFSLCIGGVRCGP